MSMRAARAVLARIALLALGSATPRAARAGEPVTVPVDVGIGPAGYLITGRVADDQPLHYGLKISVQAIIDQQTLRAHPERIPPRYRARALQLKEVRVSPSILIPDALIISPKLQNTGIYGITWRPISLSLPLVDQAGVRLVLGAGLLATYAYIDSELPEIPATHFLRPGLDLGAELEVALGPALLLSLGWSSGLYIPQELGGFGLATQKTGESASDALARSVWHLGQAFIKLHVRFPYTTRL
jgi:hypothetical protein